jgi:hypothetical protein
MWLLCRTRAGADRHIIDHAFVHIGPVPRGVAERLVQLLRKGWPEAVHRHVAPERAARPPRKHPRLSNDAGVADDKQGRPLEQLMDSERAWTGPWANRA